MMWAYDSLLIFAFALLRFAALFNRRLRLNFSLRKTLPDFSAAHGKLHIWFHASSAGEFEQVRAIALELKKTRKDCFFSFSYFSDSAYRAKKNDTVPDIFFALPFDFSWRMRRLVRAMRPAALVIAKYDAWANQVRASVAAGVPVYLASATLPAKSLRYRWPVKYFMRAIYAPMRKIFAVDEEHAARFRSISAANAVAMGDTRFDAIFARLQEKKAVQPELQLVKKIIAARHCLVAGSSYATSEKMIIAFIARIKKIGGKKFMAVVAPHHVNEGRIREIESECDRRGVSHARLSRAHAAKSVDILIVDALGLLAFVYPLAYIAYVGGGFEGSVHSVIEAAVAGVPTLTGPAIENSPEALALAAAGLLEVLATPDAALFAEHVAAMSGAHGALAKKIRQFFRERLGVSRRIVHTVIDDLSHS